MKLLDKIGGVWVPDGDRKHYGGAISATSCLRYRRGANRDLDGGVELCCQGILVFVGRRSPDPGRDNEWPELDSDAFAAIGM